jgi:thioredoxin 1
MKITKQQIDEVIKNKGVLQFSASWCMPCKVLTRTIEDNQGKLQHVQRIYIDLDTNQELATEYNVRSVPTLILFENGQESKRTVGSKSIDQLLEFIGGEQ